MLNEMMEFEAYVKDPQSVKPRLQPKILTNTFKQDVNGYILRGLDLIMTIILRDFLFSDHKRDLFDGNGLITDEGIIVSKELLNRWSGFYEITEAATAKPSESVDGWLKKNQQADGWLKEFWIFHFNKIQERKKQAKKDSETEWYKLARAWSEKYNSDQSYQAKIITYDNIIANAIERGPLRERYCVVKKGDAGKEIETLKDLYGYIFPKSDESKPKPQQRTYHRMLKNIVAFLIGQDEHPGVQKEVLLQRLRLFGWYGKDDGDLKVKNWCFEQFFWKDRSIMYNHSHPDYAKFGIRQDYLNEFGFRLIDPKEEEKYSERYWILQDSGYGDDYPLTIINK